MTWETEDQLHDLGQVTATLNLSSHAYSKGLIKPGACCCLVAATAPSCGLQPARLLCPRASPGKSTGVGSCSLLQGIFLTQGWNLGLLHCRQILHRRATREARRLGGVRPNPFSPLCTAAALESGTCFISQPPLSSGPGDCVLTPSRAVSESGLETSAVPLLCSLPSPGVGI